MTGARVVAVVAALDRADTIAATVSSLLALGRVDEVVVVDDGSTDGTAAAARSAGARVLRLPRNVGKGGAVAAGVAAASDADVYLLVDADVGATAGGASALLDPVLAGAADLVIGVLPPAGSKGGFGRVRRLAAAGIGRATGFRPRAPLSGQRAARGALLRSLPHAERFGLEVAMTIDAIRAGATVLEVDVDMDHRHTGRTPSGFRHRARQGRDIVVELWPRLTTARQRIVVAALVFILAAGGALWSASRGEPPTVPVTGEVERVVVFGIPGLSWDDLESARLPNVDALRARGSLAAMSVRTVAGRPSTVEGYASLGAGGRVRADDQGGYAFGESERVEGSTARLALERRAGKVSAGRIVVVGAPAVVRQTAGRHLPSAPGALGAALAAAGRTTAAIGNADTGFVPGRRARILRPVAIAAMDGEGVVDDGRVDAGLLMDDPTAPFGRRADPDAVMAAVRRARAADLLVVDPGDMDRVAAFASVSTPTRAEAARELALQRTDALLGRVVDEVGPGTLVLVVAVTPPDRDWHLTPLLVAGPRVPHGTLYSPATRRGRVVTLSDVGPTALQALGVEAPDGMIGQPLRAETVPVATGGLARLDRDAGYRERIYLPVTLWYIVLQALVYLFAITAFSRLGGAGRASPFLRFVVLAIAAHPLGTFLLRAVPGAARLGWGGVALLVLIDLAIAALATRARRHSLSPLQWILGLTVAVLVLDVATGARLQLSSILGYSPHTAARFRGLGNTAFATLAATTVLYAAIWVDRARRRNEALLGAALLFALVVLVDGAPSLGSDVGGILTLVPVFGLTLLAMTGRRVSWRAAAVAVLVTLLAIVGAATIDFLQAPESRTHLGRLVADVQADGTSPLMTTVARKVSTNFRTYRSPWTWAVVVLTVYMLLVLVWARGWSRLLPPRSALRAGTVGTLAAGLVGYATNDSGIVVTALVFVYLGPFLTLVALEREDADPVLLQ